MAFVYLKKYFLIYFEIQSTLIYLHFITKLNLYDH